MFFVETVVWSILSRYRTLGGGCNKPRFILTAIMAEKFSLTNSSADKGGVYMASVFKKNRPFFEDLRWVGL